ncbi:hypothetical protein COC42_11495 [Sphingomonas spermidinifaciens]|uniref:Methylamine dehydrogenase n=1 Tax=Sphingomonas spermidinifaciens TaxID=1141889 RepID=A0A2A4B2Y7_9SPHN|nr:hypothetical protein [Sphingomonas spermidinifaciens]PCD02098.1 hypothetical protein COC42_11495 [Sphingomonas spermidinifaciens]
MLIASHFLLWIAIVLLGVAWFALDRRVRALAADRPVEAAAPRVPVVSAATLTGETLTIGRASRDGRALLLLFAAPDCTRSAAALREAIALGDPARLRLVLVGEGDPAGYQALARLHQIGERDIVIGGAVAEDLGIAVRPAAMLVAADGTTLASGAVETREQLVALIAALPREAAPARSARIVRLRPGLAGTAASGG